MGSEISGKSRAASRSDLCGPLCGAWTCGWSVPANLVDLRGESGCV